MGIEPTWQAIQRAPLSPAGEAFCIMPEEGPMRYTYTNASLPVSAQAHQEIRAKLEAAGYEHAIGEDGRIDMHGIALVVEDRRQRLLDMDRTGIKTPDDW